VVIPSRSEGEEADLTPFAFIAFTGVSLEHFADNSAYLEKSVHVTGTYCFSLKTRQ
jgi:hypothetical protein